MKVLGMTRPGCEPATYRMRGGHVYHFDLANPTRLRTWTQALPKLDPRYTEPDTDKLNHCGIIWKSRI